MIRQIKGVDSNKLQPIIRYHNDKDFKVPSTMDMEPLNYREIILKPRKPPVYSLEMNESSDAIENRTLADDEENFKGYSKKRMSKSTNDN